MFCTTNELGFVHTKHNTMNIFIQNATTGMRNNRVKDIM
jgi:hypothetical protein